MENNNKRQTIFLSVVGIATLLVAIIGATFAWFSAQVTGNDTASSVIVQTATLGINYTNGNEIKLLNAIPGANQQKTFTISADENANTNQSYKIKWDIVDFDFADKSDLVYTLTGTGNDAGGTLVNVASKTEVPTSSAAIDGTGILAPTETHTYTLYVEFKETGSDQNSNQGKKFAGKIQVEAVNSRAA